MLAAGMAAGQNWQLARDKMRSGADLNGDNLCVSRVYLQISDHCRVTVTVRNMVRVSITVWGC